MTALTANSDITRMVDTEIREWPVGVEEIFRNAFVGIDPAGNLKPFVPGDRFVGIAYEAVDNSGGSAGDLFARVIVEGDFSIPVSSTTELDDGGAVYATDDGAVATSGHPDAFVGRMLHLDADVGENMIVRMRWFAEPRAVYGDLTKDAHWDGRAMLTATGAVAAASLAGPDGLMLQSTLGLGIVKSALIGCTFEFDNTSEVALATIQTNEEFLVSKGVTFEVDLHLTDIGGATALDTDWGLATVIDGTTRLNMDDATATDIALFHMDGNSANILAQSDDNTADVAPVDTTAVNVTTAVSGVKKFKIIVRPSGVCEFWINKARVLSATAFAMRTTAVVGGLVNMEKTADTTLGVLQLNRIRVAGVNA